MIKTTQTEFKNSIQSLREYMTILSENNENSEEQQMPESLASQAIKAAGRGISDYAGGAIKGLQGTKTAPLTRAPTGRLQAASDATKSGHNFGKNVAPGIGAAVGVGGAAGTAGMMANQDANGIDEPQNTQAFPANKNGGREINPGIDASTKIGGQGVAANKIHDLPPSLSDVNPEKIAIQAHTGNIGKTTPTKPAMRPDPIIKAAQLGLIAGGFLPSGADDGIMGPRTKEAYAKFSATQSVNEHVSFGAIPELARIMTLSRH